MQVLTIFYGKAKEAKVEAALSLDKATPAEAAPEAGFKNSKAYKGDQARSGGLACWRSLSPTLHAPSRRLRPARRRLKTCFPIS